MKDTEKSISSLKRRASSEPSAKIMPSEEAEPILATTVETVACGKLDLRQRVIAPLVLVALLCQLCTGCLLVPIPASGRKVTANWKAQASKLEADRATREQVIRQLGSPAWDFQDLQVIGYAWEVVEWSVFWLLAGGYNAAGGLLEPPSHRLLWMAFDAEDRLRHSQVVSRSESKTGWEQAVRWRQKLDPPLPTIPPTRFAPWPPPPDKAVVHVIWDKGTSYSPVGPVLIDGKNRAEIRKGCFTTLVLGPGCYQLALLGGCLDLDLAAGQVCFLDFHPKGAGSAAEPELSKCPETEALTRLQRLQFCR